MQQSCYTECQEGALDMNFDPATLNRINQIVGGVTLVIGLALLLGGGYWIERQREFIAKSVVAEGRVIENQREQWSDSKSSHTSYRAIVSFTDQRGQVITYRDKIAFNPPSFTVGQSVQIFYDPQDPQRAMIDRGQKNYLIPVIACALGGLFILGSLQRLFRR